ncbi:MAG TPA: hypothetical protein VGP26_03825 [Actinophytocola sp.]|jgi:hypothetical protein|nr:hypothetical protein [Actinophytocola sp.]
MASIGAEIKFTLPGDQVAAGLAAFGLRDERADGVLVYFLDRLDAAGDPWLFGHHVVLRVRREPDDSGDVTAKLRPVEPGRLTGRWRPGIGHDRADYAVEYDWAAEKCLAASATVRHGTGVAALLDGPRKQVFSPEQQDFLRRCGPALEQPMRDLAAAGPVAARRWSVEDLKAEQWTWGTGHTVLELSLRCADGDAADRRARLAADLERLGLKPDDTATTKTEAVLRDLL